MTDETTLLPCPFCGGEVEIYNPMPGYESGYGMYCKSCDSYFTHGDDEQEAIEAWNTRYESTCTLEINTDMSAIRCDKCGYEVPKGTVIQDVKYCLSCGARVIEE